MYDSNFWPVAAHVISHVLQKGEQETRDGGYLRVCFFLFECIDEWVIIACWSAHRLFLL